MKIIIDILGDLDIFRRSIYLQNPAAVVFMGVVAKGPDRLDEKKLTQNGTDD